MRRLLLAIAVVGLLAADDAPAVVDDTADDAGGGTPAADAEDITGATEVQIGLGDFAFSPASLRGAAGQQLEVTLTNRGAVPHTFTSDALGVDEQLDPGATTTVTVSLPGSGSVAFYCRFHRSQGMEGAFLVGDSEPSTASTNDPAADARPGY